MRIEFFLYFVFSISFPFLFVNVSGKNMPPPVSDVKVNDYLGHWIQVYAAPTNVVFQGYGTCITADYGLLDNGNISVLNSQLDEHKEIEQISGYGYYTNISEPGKLTVHLEGVPVDSPYWIIKLGESKNSQYQYTIITTPSYISLWVLVRDLTNFSELYDAEITDFLNQYDFRYVPVSQNNCNSKLLNRRRLRTKSCSK